MQKLLLKLIKLYQNLLKGLLLIEEGSCRFSPVCSKYCYQAIESNGSIKGLWLCFKRLLRCNPLFVGGKDPLLSTLGHD